MNGPPEDAARLKLRHQGDLTSCSADGECATVTQAQLNGSELGEPYPVSSLPCDAVMAHKQGERLSDHLTKSYRGSTGERLLFPVLVDGQEVMGYELVQEGEDGWSESALYPTNPEEGFTAGVDRFRDHLGDQRAEVMLVNLCPDERHHSEGVGGFYALASDVGGEKLMCVRCLYRSESGRAAEDERIYSAEEFTSTMRERMKGR